MAKRQIIENYNQLWHTEKAFRISKTDLRIRPIYHRTEDRIRSHICIAFTAYCVYKELERILYKEKSTTSITKVVEVTHNMHQINYALNESRRTRAKLPKIDDESVELCTIIQKNYLGVLLAETDGLYKSLKCYWTI